MEVEVPVSKFSARKATEEGKTVIYLCGQIDEDATFDSFEKEEGAIVFDFEGITVINSCGVRNWVNFMKHKKGQDISFRNCPPVIVKQLNLVPSFKGEAKVLSLYVPYVCMNCDHETRTLVDMKTLSSGAVIAEVLKCEACGEEEMEIDGDEKQFRLAG